MIDHILMQKNIIEILQTLLSVRARMKKNFVLKLWASLLFLQLFGIYLTENESSVWE